ncbi:hypothetical protein ACS0TY_025045 [Phlomoides rotata]
MGAQAKRDRIEEVIRAELKKKKNLLLVVDGQSEGSKMKLNWSQEKDGKKKLHLMVDGQSEGINLGALLGLDVQSHKVLITSTNQPADSEGIIGLVVRPLTWDESRSLVSQQMDGDQRIS